MKEHPISFNEEMLKAILEGRKTQTRRIIEPQPSLFDDSVWTLKIPAHGIFYSWIKDEKNPPLKSICPWIIGDILLVENTNLKLEVTNIRAERVQDISIEDAKAECATYPEDLFEQLPLRNKPMSIRQLAFAKYWDSLHGPDAWDRNDWVWVIEFKVMEA